MVLCKEALLNLYTREREPPCRSATELSPLGLPRSEKALPPPLRGTTAELHFPEGVTRRRSALATSGAAILFFTALQGYPHPPAAIGPCSAPCFLWPGLLSTSRVRKGLSGSQPCWGSREVGAGLFLRAPHGFLPSLSGLPAARVPSQSVSGLASLREVHSGGWRLPSLRSTSSSSSFFTAFSRADLGFPCSVLFLLDLKAHPDHVQCMERCSVLSVPNA